MVVRSLMALIAGALLAGASPPPSPFGAALQAGVDARRVAPAWVRYLPLTILQKAAMVEDLPDDARFTALGADYEPAPLDVGYAYREIRIFWMPFFAWDAGGFVFFSRTGSGQYSIAPATELEFMRITQVIGVDPRAGYSFSPLRHMWGWLALIPAFFAWRRYRAWDDTRREALGMM